MTELYFTPLESKVFELKRPRLRLSDLAGFYQELCQLSSRNNSMQIDLGNLKQLDSVILGCLLHEKRKAQDLGREIRFHNIPQAICEVINILGIEPESLS